MMRRIIRNPVEIERNEVMRACLTAAFVITISFLPSTAAIAQEATDTFFDTRKAQYFGDATAALAEYLKSEQPLAQRHHHFCVVGYQGRDKTRRAYVHWREGHKLILWEGSTDPDHASESIKNSRRQLDLSKDVVKSEADVGGSSYLVTESWVAKVKADCAKHGNTYSVSSSQNKVQNQGVTHG